MTNSATASLPWDSKLSKNSRHVRGRGNRTIVVKEVRVLEEKIIEQIKSVGGSWFDAKVWLTLYVEMPTRKTDAINVIDTVADAVKIGIGVDDKWFCIKSLDWNIVKDDPTVTITVEQTATEHTRFCGRCKRYLPLTAEFYNVDQSYDKGMTCNCKDCNKEVNKIKYRKRRSKIDE